MKICCKTCSFYIFEDITYGYVCCNSDSEHCADWVEANQICNAYESKESVEAISKSTFLGSSNGFYKEIGLGIVEALLLEGKKASFVEAGFEGIVTYSDDDKLFCGRIQGIDKQLFFSGETVEAAYNDFIKVINEYKG